MTQTFTYHSAFGATTVFSVDLGTEVIRLGEVPGWEERAEHLQSGSCEVILDDPDADVGNSGDAILGNEVFIVTESDCVNTMTGEFIIGRRTYARGDGTRPSLKTGASRQIGIELHDINALASVRVIPHTALTARRPRETVDDRMQWLIASPYLSLIADSGLVATSTKMMDANDYRGQRAVQVVNDCEQAAGFGWNAFVYWDDAASATSLFFDNANTSTAFTSDIKISNVLSDIDDFADPAALIFAPDNAVLTRDPTELGDSVYLPYKNGVVFRSRAATKAIYGQKDLIMPSANVKHKTTANRIADDLLFQHRNEEDRITCTIDLPPSKVNLLRAGMRMLCRFSHLPGYEGWNWFRVLMRAPGNIAKTEDRYTVQLELSPQEGGCSVEPTFVHHRYVDVPDVASSDWPTTPPKTRFWFRDDASATSPGNLLIVAVNSAGDPVTASPSSDWNIVIQDENTQVGLGGDYCHLYWKKSAGDAWIDLDFGIGIVAFRVALIEYAGLTNPTVYDSDIDRRDPGLGYGVWPAISFPSGPSALVGVCFMKGGPQGSDDLEANGGPTLRTAISGGLHGSQEVAFADVLQDGASGTVPLVPWTSYYGFQFAGPEETLTVGLTFTGDNCA